MRTEARKDDEQPRAAINRSSYDIYKHQSHIGRKSKELKPDRDGFMNDEKSGNWENKSWNNHVISAAAKHRAGLPSPGLPPAT